MTSLSGDIQADVIEAFNSTSRYLGDLLNIDNPYFEGMVNQIYPPELQLNNANVSDNEVYIYLFLTVLLHPKFMISSTTLLLINFPLLGGDVPRRTSYSVYISQLI